MASQKVRKMKNQKNNLLKLLKDFAADSRKQGLLRDRLPTRHRAFKGF
jgi:hypothetical protein